MQLTRDLFAITSSCYIKFLLLLNQAISEIWSLLTRLLLKFVLLLLPSLESRPSLSSSLKITDRSFRYMHLLAFVINFVPHSVNIISWLFFSLLSTYCLSSSVPSSPLSLSITPTLFHSKLQTKIPFLNPSRHRLPPLPSDCLYRHWTAQWFFSFSIPLTF